LKVQTGGSVTAAILGTDYTNFGYLFTNNATNTLLAFNGGLTFTNATGTNLFAAYAAANSAAFGATGTTTITSAGFLGIGTSTPGSALSVAGNEFIAGNITSTSTTASIFPYASSTALTAGNLFATNGSITSLITTGATTTSFAITNLSNGLLKVNGSGSIILATPGSDYLTSASIYAFPFTPTNNFSTNVNATSTILLFSGGLQASSSVQFGNAGVSGFTFNSATGNLGLGTTSPYALLSLLAASTSNTQNLFVISSTSNDGTTTPLFRVQSNGTVSINGTASTSILYISGVPATLLKTDANGKVVPAIPDVDYATGGTGSGSVTWQVAYGALTPTTTLGILVNASSTIGGIGGGLTIEGSATTTGNAYIAGTLGIGTNQPAGPLDVAIGSGGTAYIGTANVISTLQLTNGGFISNGGAFRISGNTRSGVNAPITLEPGGFEAMRVTTAGLVGIETTNPKSYLDVGNNVTIGADYASVNAAPSNGLLVEGAVAIGTTSPSAYLTVQAPSSLATPIFVIATSSAFRNLLSVASDGNGTTTLAGLNINASATTTSNVGIKLTGGCFAMANGACLQSASFSYLFPNSATTTVLAFNGGLTAYASTTIGNGTATGGLTVSGTATTTNLIFTGLSNTLLKVNAQGSVVAAISGTDYAAFAYPFAGNATTTLIAFNGGLTFTNATGSSLFTNVLASSIARFGATATSSFNSIGQLDLASTNGNSTSTLITFGGRSFLSASSSVGNLFLGLDSGSQITRGNNNTAIGYQAMQYATTSHDNVALGFLALQGTTSTSNLGFGFGGKWGNVAIGSLALGSSTNGYWNEAIGYGAMQFVKDNANSNVGIGPFALQGTTSQNQWLFDDIGIGAYSLQSVENGTDNIALGYFAGQTITDGYSNIAIGQYSLSQNKTGNLNVGIGANALGGNAFPGGNIFQNVGVGYDAGDLLTTGVNNTFLGFRAGHSVTNGYANILLGSHDSTANVITTGNGNIGLGNELYFPDATANNQLNIGGILFGTLPATSTQFSLPTSGSIGIGTSTPFAKFSIAANSGDTAQTLFAIGSSTASATTTLFSISNTGLVTGLNQSFTNSTTTSLAITNLSTQAGQCLTISNTGVVTTQSCTTGGFAYLFPSNATSTLLNFNGGLTSASSTLTGNTALQNATTTSFAISSLTNGLLKVNGNGSVILATPGSDYLTAASIFAYPFVGNATTTLIAFNGGLTFTNATGTNLFTQYLASSQANFGATGTSTFTSAGFLGIGTSSPGSALSIQGNQFIAGNITSTSTTASIFPYASSTALSATNINISGSSALGTITSGTWNGTAIGATFGGTGQTTYAAGDILYANTASSLARIASSTGGTVLAMVNGIPTWVATTTLANISGTLAVTSGGTGQTTFTSSNLLYGAGNGALQSVATSTVSNGTAISVTGTGAVVGGGLTINFSAPASSALTIPYASTTAITATTASSSLLYVNGLGCAAGQYITWSNGTFGCAADQNSSATVFSFSSTFSTTSAATTSSIWTQGVFFSSSTALASQFPYASSTAFTTGNFFGDECHHHFSRHHQHSPRPSSKPTPTAPSFPALSGTDYAAFGYLFPSNATTTLINFNGGLTFTNATGTNIFTQYLASSQANFGATGTTTITSSGFLGIGTSSPGSALSVAGNEFIAGNITSTSTTASIFPYASTTAITATNASTTNLTISSLNASAGQCLTIDVTGRVTTQSCSTGNFAYLFPNNATTTLLNFNNGLTAYASTTIGNGTATGGLTVSGTATTTNLIFTGLSNTLSESERTGKCRRCSFRH
jgi:hypothetical protein